MNPRYKFSVDVMNEYGEDIDEYNYEKDNPEQYQTQPVQSINPDDSDPEGFKFQPLPGLNPSDIPTENQKYFPSLNDTFTNTIPDGYEAAVMQFYPMTLDGVDPFDRKCDVSFNALYYLGLGGLGGKYVTWQLGREFMSDEEKKRKDMNDNRHHCYCDKNHGQTFLIEDLLNNAMQAGYKGYPPIFTQSGHVGCKCSLIFNKYQNFPNGAQDISDTCPSMPITDNQTVLFNRKTEIYNAIPDVIQIYSYVEAPMYITSKQASVAQRRVYADDSSIPMNRPIVVNKNSIAVMNFGFWQAIPEGSFGFVLSAKGAYVDIYYIDFLCKARIKRDNITLLDNLKATDSSSLGKDTYFIMSEGKLGALCYQRSGRYHAYFPDIDRIKEVDDITVLEVGK